MTPLVPKSAPKELSMVKAILNSVGMTLMFILGLTLIQFLFHRSVDTTDRFVQYLEYASIGSGYCLLALPAWGIFDTLKRTKLYIEGPKMFIAVGYLAVLASTMYSAYYTISWGLHKYL